MLEDYFPQDLAWLVELTTAEIKMPRNKAKIVKSLDDAKMGDVLDRNYIMYIVDTDRSLIEIDRSQSIIPQIPEYFPVSYYITNYASDKVIDLTHRGAGMLAMNVLANLKMERLDSIIGEPLKNWSLNDVTEENLTDQIDKIRLHVIMIPTATVNVNDKQMKLLFRDPTFMLSLNSLASTFQNWLETRTMIITPTFYISGSDYKPILKPLAPSTYLVNIRHGPNIITQDWD